MFVFVMMSIVQNMVSISIPKTLRFRVYTAPIHLPLSLPCLHPLPCLGLLKRLSRSSYAAVHAIFLFVCLSRHDQQHQQESTRSDRAWMYMYATVRVRMRARERLRRCLRGRMLGCNAPPLAATNANSVERHPQLFRPLLPSMYRYGLLTPPCSTRPRRTTTSHQPRTVGW